MGTKVENLAALTRQVNVGANGISVTNSSGSNTTVSVSQIELDDPTGDPNYRTIIRKENGALKFIKVNRNDGTETDETPDRLYTQAEVDAMMDDMIDQINTMGDA
jgi:ACT domain-containing protein